MLTKDDGTFDLTQLDDTTRKTFDGYYKDKNALFQVTIESGKEQKAINAIYDIIGEDGAIIGSSVEQAISQNIALTQSIKAIMFIAPLIIIILILATTSWIEPFIYLTTIGIAVVINLGLNIFRGSMSYVTFVVAPLLQLALSLDYAVFLQKSFDKYREQKINVKDAMKLAMKDSLKAILASALTTLFGFVALMFMDFKIGPDMGISLVFGVILSFIAVLTFLPALILCTYKLNDKCKHKAFLPTFKKLSNGLVFCKLPIFLLISILMFLSFNAQKKTTYIYCSGGTSSESRLARDTVMIESSFGHNNMMAILVPVGNYDAEVKLYQDLEKLDYVKSVISFANTVGFDVPIEMIPNDIKANFYS